MRYLQIARVTEGMISAKNILSSSGGVFIRQGTVLNDKNISKLQEFGFAGVYIEDEISQGIEIEDLVRSEVREKAINCVKNQDIDGCGEVANEIVHEILENQDLSLNLIDMRSIEDFILSHSLNVAVYSCIIGMGMGYKQAFLDKLTFAALIHDLGKMSIPEDILHKASRLTPEEYNKMKKHPIYSYRLIEKRPEISDYVKEAVLHHHENEDGSGYPDGLMGEEQSIYTKILHVADVYDALISRRPFKEPYSPSEAVEYLMGGCDIMFDRDVVNSLIKFVPLFPLGVEVKLSDGRKGIIYKNSGVHNIRPLVRMFDGNEIDLSLSENANYVVRMLDSAESNIMESSELERRKMVDATKKIKLLVVDDVLTNLQMLRDILEGKYDAVYVKSGEQALNYLSTNNMPDLILMDIEMPDLNGVDTVRIIRNRYGNVPVLYVTARRDVKTVMKCKEMNMSGYIIKPYHATFVIAEIERIVHGRNVN